ncbi:MAG: ATP-dependent helicase [Candidatus Nanopelagicales bacterium]
MSAARADLERVLGHPLSDPQWTAVSAPLEPAAIVAGAGSGKTTVMAARVVWLVLQGLARPDEALGLTFTTKAAGELLGRGRRFLAEAQRLGLIADDMAIEPAVSTYHSFAARILDDHGVRVGLEPGAEVLADGAREALAAHVVRGTSLPLAGLDRSPTTLIQAMLALDDTLAELDLAPEAVLDDAVRLIADLQGRGRLQKIGTDMLATARVRAALCGLVEEFREIKRTRQVIDFADQVRWALAIVRDSSDVRESLRQQHSCVLLDEYQDTSVAQRLLLQAAFGKGHPVTAVGDPCQAIYEWRGASVDNLDRFPVHFPAGDRPAARYPLADNRRSGPRILDLANEIAAPLRAIHAGVEPLTAAATDRGPGDVRCALLATVAEEHDWVADEVERLHRQQGAWRGIAVLARKGETLVDIDRVLRARGVPTHLVGLTGLLSVPVVADVRATLEVIDDPTANAACIRLLDGPRWRIGPRDLAALGRLASSLLGDRERQSDADVERQLRAAVTGADAGDVVSLAEAIDRVAAGEGLDVSEEARARLTRLSVELALLRRHRDEPPADLVSRVLRVTGLGVEMAIGPADEVADRARALAAFRELAAAFPAGLGTVRPTLSGFLARLRNAEAFGAVPTLDDVPADDAVVLMSAHRAKGLEFAHVIVPGMCAGVFPSAVGRERWPTNAAVVPWHLRDDAPAGVLGFPDHLEGPRAKDHTAFIDASAALAELEERRLAYVALTRAERSLSVSAHWWGPTQVRSRGPGTYLEEIHDWCLAGGGEVVTWAPEPDDAANPLLDESRVPWPRPVDDAARAVRMAAAGLVERARLGDLAPAEVSMDERRIVDSWDAAAVALLEEARAARRPRPVSLPLSLSASDLVRLHDDPEAFARDLVRPMPRRPSAAARRGTALHSWIEGQYSVQTLFDLDDLESADEIVTDEQQLRMREAFLRTPYASRAPVAIERRFAVTLAGRIVRGRIDAVFRDGSGRYEVVDWKTGGRGGLRDLQLAIYRLAWSQISGVPEEEIEAAFVMVPTGDVVRPVSLPDRRGIEELLSGR